MKRELPTSKGGGGEGIEWERVGGSFGGWARSKAVTILFLTIPDAKKAVQNCQSYKTITLHCGLIQYPPCRMTIRARNFMIEDAFCSHQ